MGATGLRTPEYWNQFHLFFFFPLQSSFYTIVPLLFFFLKLLFVTKSSTDFPCYFFLTLFIVDVNALLLLYLILGFNLKA